ncbi:hypothetical protein K438DRAFT_1812402 [Mycena galopus ATCC 62051]|nr:hypothetical protein K438DRAFT_1812402 [Mycena galopus ATCC 62051]
MANPGQTGTSRDSSCGRQILPLRTALRHAPCLTHLGLTRSRYRVDDALAALTFAEDGVDPLIPRLHHLDLEDARVHLPHFNLILENMIISRWWTDAELAARLLPPAVARWTHVKLRGKRFSEQLMHSMELLQKQGLSVDYCSDF